MLRFSLFTLMCIVSIAALGSAALANPSEMWRLVIFNLTLTILLAAALTAVVKRWPFAVGFAVTGWIYFALAFLDDGSIRPYMVTDKAVNWFGRTAHLPQLPSPVTYYSAPPTTIYYPPTVLPQSTPTTVAPNPIGTTPPTIYAPALLAPVPFLPVIGHSLWALLLACIGGLFTSWLARRRDGANPQTDE